MSSPGPATLILFDVDGTLLLSGRAGVRAMNRAFEDLCGVPDAFAGLSMAGRTDPAIVREALARIGRTMDDEWLLAFRDQYCVRLREAIEQPVPGKRLMPGVRALLETLRPRGDVGIGLVTGNFAEGAHIKLAYFDLAGYFGWGAFGDDAEDRNALVPIALRRAAEHGAARVPPDRVFVVGDTPADVECARAAGVRAVGVATGPYDPATLTGSGADAVLSDLGDTGAFLRVIDGDRGRAGQM